MYGYIYKRQNKLNGKVYVGQHKYDKPELDLSYKGSGLYFSNALAKYGDSAFTYELLAIANSLEELNELEYYFVRECNALAPDGYNLREGGNGKFVTEESIRILSEKAKQRFADPEYLECFRQMRIKWLAEHPEYSARMSELRKGEGNPMFGKHQTDKQKQAVADAARYERSTETRTKLSNANKGKTPWNKGTKGGKNSGCGSYWITDGTIEGTKKWYDKYGPLPEGFHRGRTVPKRHKTVS